MSDEITDAITENAAGGVKSVTTAAGSTTFMSVDEQIKADQYVASKTAASGARRGLVITKLRPPGAT